MTDVNVPVEMEQQAHAWLDGKFGSPEDQDYSADQMIDAYMEGAAHRLTALSSASGDVVAWQSIETAPRDGTLIVGLDRTTANTGWMYPFVMQWDRMHWHWNDGLQWKRWPGDGPSVWAPIPSMPTSTLAASAREVKA